MIIVDTNVISEFFRIEPSLRVRDWMNGQNATELYTTTITVMELRQGCLMLDAGRARTRIEGGLARMISETFDGRILPFDIAAAEAAGELFARRRRNGFTVEIRDTQIAGIAIAHGGAIAMRNVRHFSDLSVDVIDPWRA